MLAEEGMYKVVGAVVLAVFFFVLVCRLLGYQAKIIEGFSFGLGDSSGTNNEAADHHARKAMDNHHKSKAGQAELRPDQEKQIENLDERLRAELLHHVLDKTKDKKGNWINPLLTEDDLIGNPKSMALIQKLNELWKFRGTLEAAISTLDNIDATTLSMTGHKGGGFSL
jgi:hypothetical protein